MGATSAKGDPPSGSSQSPCRGTGRWRRWGTDSRRAARPARRRRRVAGLQNTANTHAQPLKAHPKHLGSRRQRIRRRPQNAGAGEAPTSKQPNVRGILTTHPTPHHNVKGLHDAKACGRAPRELPQSGNRHASPARPAASKPRRGSLRGPSGCCYKACRCTSPRRTKGRSPECLLDLDHHEQHGRGRWWRGDREPRQPHSPQSDVPRGPAQQQRSKFGRIRSCTM